MSPSVRQVVTIILMAFLAGCAESNTDTEAGLEENINKKPSSSQPVQELPFEEDWAFQADIENPFVVEFRPSSEATLNISVKITNFIGTNMSVVFPMNCGTFVLGPMDTTIETEWEVGSIKCFVNRSVHQIRVYANGTVEGTIHAYKYD